MVGGVVASQEDAAEIDESRVWAGPGSSGCTSASIMHPTALTGAVARDSRALQISAAAEFVHGSVV